MRLQCNGIATHCDCNALQSDCKAMRLQCDGAVAIGRLLQCDCNATRCDCNATQCDGTVWPSSSLVLCLSQGPREEGRRRARRGGGEVGSPSWARGPRRRKEDGCDCNATQCDCNAMRLPRNAMRLQWNWIAAQRDCNAMQCDGNAMRMQRSAMRFQCNVVAMPWGGCHEAAGALRLQWSAL